MRTTLTVPAKTKEDAVVEAALILEQRAKDGDYQRITGEPKRTPILWRGIQGMNLWHVPVEDAPGDAKESSDE